MLFAVPSLSRWIVALIPRSGFWWISVDLLDNWGFGLQIRVWFVKTDLQSFTFSEIGDYYNLLMYWLFKVAMHMDSLLLLERASLLVLYPTLLVMKICFRLSCETLAFVLLSNKCLFFFFFFVRLHLVLCNVRCLIWPFQELCQCTRWFYFHIFSFLLGSFKYNISQILILSLQG